MKQLLILGCICLSSIAFGQKLRFKVDGVADTTVFLTKYVGQKLYYADTAQLKNGIAEFDKKNLKPGILAFLMPGQKYFEFVYNNEEINIETSAKDLIGAMKVKKSEENKVFISYIQYIQQQRNKSTELSKIRDGLSKDDPKYTRVTEQMDSVSKLVSAYQQKLLKDHANLLTAKIIKMSVDVEIPDYPRDANGNVTDSSYRYKYYRAHFWDNIDLKDERLVNTPVFHQKLEYFFGKNMIIQHPDSVLAAAFPFCDALNPSGELFKYSVDYITNSSAKSNIMGMDKVFVRMCERYYCRTNPATGKSYAYWMPEDKLKSLCEDIDIKKHLVQGVVPPNIILRDTTDATWRDFYSLKNEYVILYFWDPECGHCKKTTPKLQQLYAEKLKARGVEIFAVGKATGEDFEKWKQYIRDNKLTFINVGLTNTLYKAAMEDARQFVPKYTTLESLNYHDTYDIYATPRIIVLDKDKKIVAKQLTISQLEDLLDRLQNVKDPVKMFPPDPEDEAH